MNPIAGARRRFRRSLSRLAITRRSFHVTREGWVFVVVTLLIGLAALNTSAQLLFLVFAMLCSFWMMSAIVATSGQRRLDASRMLPRLAVAGRPAPVRLRVRNGKVTLDSYSLRVTDHLEGGAAVGAVFFPRIRRRSSAEAEYECLFPRRGSYALRRIVIATRFPFGLIERRLILLLPDELVVLPPTVPMDRVLRTARVDMGEQELNIKGRGTNLYGIRAYQPGESARDIHWRVSARTGTLMIREFEVEERRRASVILDNRLPPDATPDQAERFEEAVVLAGSTLAWLEEHGHQTELLTAAGKVAFGSGPSHLLRCRRALATLQFDPTPRAHGPLPHEPAADSAQFVIVHRGDESVSPDATRLDVREFRDMLQDALRDHPTEDDTEIPGIERLAPAS